MKTTAKEHLKAKLSIKYCDGTRYDYLDDDEELLILKAMKSYASEQTAKYKEFIEAYQNLLNCFGMSKPKNKTNIDSLDKAWERITALEKEISINLK